MLILRSQKYWWELHLVGIIVGGNYCWWELLLVGIITSGVNYNWHELYLAEIIFGTIIFGRIYICQELYLAGITFGGNCIWTGIIFGGPLENHKNLESAGINSAVIIKVSTISIA